jgi:hypothetical protein
MHYRQLISKHLSRRQRRQIKDLVAKQLNIVPGYDYESDCDLPYQILIGTHHKTGTNWLNAIFRSICTEYALSFRYGEQAQLTGDLEVFLQDHSHFDLRALENEFRGLHMIRDPRDVIISGCFYHQKSDEAWLHQPRADFGGKSYREALRECRDQEAQLAFEMAHTAKDTIADMLSWDYHHPRFFEVKYEDLMADTELMLFHRIFVFLGFPTAVLPKLLKIAFDNSLFSGRLKKGGHIRSGKTRQWRQYFTKAVGHRFLDLYGDALIALGYEKDNRWLDACRG